MVQVRLVGLFITIYFTTMVGLEVYYFLSQSYYHKAATQIIIALINQICAPLFLYCAGIMKLPFEWLHPTSLGLYAFTLNVVSHASIAIVVYCTKQDYYLKGIDLTADLLILTWLYYAMNKLFSITLNE